MREAYILIQCSLQFYKSRRDLRDSKTTGTSHYA